MADDAGQAPPADDEDALKALAQRCLPDPILERFFRDEESEEGPARWTPVHLERYARVLAADGALRHVGRRVPLLETPGGRRVGELGEGVEDEEVGG